MGPAETGPSLEGQWGRRPEDMELCIEVVGEAQEARQGPKDDGWRQKVEKYGHASISSGLQPALVAVVSVTVVAPASVLVLVRPVLSCVVRALLDREPALVLEQCQR